RRHTRFSRDWSSDVSLPILNAQKVARPGKYYRFVHHHPLLHPVAKTPGTKSRIIRKPVDYPTVGPATPPLQCLRKIPVVERNPEIGRAACRERVQVVVGDVS